MNENCPCKECICVAVCRFKSYGILVTDCIDIFQYLYVVLGKKRPDFSPHIGEIKKHMNPDAWYTVEDRHRELVVLHFPKPWR